MARQKPVIRADIHLAANPAQAEGAAGRVQLEDPVHQFHAAAGQPRRLTKIESCEERTKAGGQVAVAQGVNPIVPIRLDGHRNEILPVGRLHAGHGPPLEIGFDDPRPCIEFFAGEEPGAAVAHGHHRLPVDRGVEVKPEQLRITLPEEPLDADIVMDGLAGLGQAAVERHDRIEQPVHRQALRLEINAQIGR